MIQPSSTTAGQVAPSEDAARTRAIPEDSLILIPVRNVVLFPGMAVSIAIGRPRSVAAAKAATKGERKIGIILQRDPKVDVPATAQLFEIGTAANIARHCLIVTTGTCFDRSRMPYQGGD